MKSVSRVMNGEPNVSDTLRAKVQGAIDALGYTPDIAARSLAGGRSFTIGLLTNDFGDGFMPSYYPELQNGAYRACRAAGYHLVVESLPSDLPHYISLLEQMLSTMRVDGFILPQPLADDHRVMDILSARGIAYTRIAPSTDLDRAPYVAMDDEGAAAEIAEHLWDVGHRAFGLVTGHPDHPAAHARRKGFAEALAAKGCTEFDEAPGEFQFEIGIGAAKQLMQSDNPPTAIFAANDDSAAGLMAGLAQLGLKVPGDVSVAGFDDSWIARSVWPYLTTIHQPIAEMAYVAATMLIEPNGAMAQSGAVMLDYHLVARGSTSAPKGVT